MNKLKERMNLRREALNCMFEEFVEMESIYGGYIILERDPKYGSRTSVITIDDGVYEESTLDLTLP